MAAENQSGGDGAGGPARPPPVDDQSAPDAEGGKNTSESNRTVIIRTTTPEDSVELIKISSDDILVHSKNIRWLVRDINDCASMLDGDDGESITRKQARKIHEQTMGPMAETAVEISRLNDCLSMISEQAIALAYCCSMHGGQSVSRATVDWAKKMVDAAQDLVRETHQLLIDCVEPGPHRQRIERDLAREMHVVKLMDDIIHNPVRQ